MLPGGVLKGEKKMSWHEFCYIIQVKKVPLGKLVVLKIDSLKEVYK